MVGCLGKDHPLGGQMMGFAQQVGQAEAEIKGGITPVNYLEVEQNQLITIEQGVFGAVVAMHQGMGALTRRRDQRVEKGRSGWDLCRRVGIVGF